ncbi:hypothetical protein GCM10009764_71150 [Nocardia ninae]|uniref:Uncharacterized protein n=1 Tax=Nocardia ninae NBRC 108245 TaxID=1210091 RepID=A0A511MMM5_9NOCA|nr:hypothetical protein NN4_63810 [Nocardia ninae NBRC 108245]
MHPLRARALPFQGGFAGGAVVGFATGLTLYEAHSFAVGDIDGRQKHETHDCASLGSVVLDAVLMVRSLRTLTGMSLVVSCARPVSGLRG